MAVADSPRDVAARLSSGWSLARSLGVRPRHKPPMAGFAKPRRAAGRALPRCHCLLLAHLRHVELGRPTGLVSRHEPPRQWCPRDVAFLQPPLVMAECLEERPSVDPSNPSREHPLSHLLFGDCGGSSSRTRDVGPGTPAAELGMCEMRLRLARRNHRGMSRVRRSSCSPFRRHETRVEMTPRPVDETA